MTLPIAPIRRVFRVVNGGTPTSSPENWGGAIAWATPIDLASCNGSKISSTQRCLTAAGLHTGSRAVPRGGLIVSSRAPIGYVSETTCTMAFNQGCKGLIPMQKVDIRFFRYQLSAMVDELQSCGQGSTFSELSTNALASIPISVPHLSMQRRVADYLDVETDRIDTLISKKGRLATLLSSRLISLAGDVTVGVGRGMRTRIPSLPEIPSSWRVLRNKVFMREVNYQSLDGTGEMLSVSHITGVTPRSEKTVYMFEAESTVGYKMVQPGDLVINTMWAWMGAAGVARTAGIVSPAYGVYSIDKSIMQSDFFDILVRTPAYVMEMTRFSRGVTSSRLRLYPDEFLSLSSPVPPIEEQRAIVNGYRAESLTTHAIRDRLARQIDLLAERRQALITAAVTGQLEIPGLAG